MVRSNGIGRGISAGIFLLGALTAQATPTSRPSAARAEAKPASTRASVAFRALEGSRIEGSAQLKEEDGKVRLEIRVSNAPPGRLAMHIHEIGNCDAPDGSSAGDHWNPTGSHHGQWGHHHFHHGDLGNIEVGPDGRGVFTMSSDLWSIGGGPETNIVGRSIVIHAGEDDFHSQPGGHSGDRIACGVIRIAEL